MGAPTFDFKDQDKSLIKAIEYAERHRKSTDVGLGYLYRLVDQRADYSYAVVIKLEAYPIVRLTPKGLYYENIFQTAWNYNEKREKLLLNNTHKRHAHKELRKAFECFARRKKAQAAIYQKRILRAEQALEQVQFHGGLTGHLAKRGLNHEYESI